MADQQPPPPPKAGESPAKPRIREFQGRDQLAVVELFRAGLQGTSTHDPNMRALQNWFINIKLSKEEGDMYDVAAFYQGSEGETAPRRCFWVAEAADDGRILGMVGVKEGSAEGVGELVRMSVKPEARGMGLGRRLLSVVEEHVRGYGGHKVELTTLLVMELACALYKGNGYSVEKVEPLIVPELQLECEPFQVVTFVKAVGEGGNSTPAKGLSLGGNAETAAQRDATDKRGKILRGLAKYRFMTEDSTPCEVVKGLFIGSIGAANSRSTLEKFNIKTVVSVCDDEPPHFPGVSYLPVTELPDRPNADILQRFPNCCDSIANGLVAGGVLVHCFQGKSRSSAVVASFLMREQGKSVQQALDQIRSVRPAAQPNIGFLAQLRTWERRCSEQRQGGAQAD